MEAPKINTRTNNTIKIKKSIFAIEAAPAAIPPNPKIAAIIAITKKITAQRNIILVLVINNLFDRNPTSQIKFAK